ncbi:hypothetical protein H5410_030449 [Solanum commersonii]|uniref:GST N-terminal domain-containing protein n=1 Tax=Solanum commersonii TaxID=4109 RepID=A0A9J5YGX2_SOLCO|nr:hypothetical protein H5410_030449 [Solanum commersonii]
MKRYLVPIVVVAVVAIVVVVVVVVIVFSFDMDVDGIVYQLSIPYSQRVWITRNVKGLQDKIKLVQIDLQNKPDWYKEKVYPTNKVPSLEHYNKVIRESLNLLNMLIVTLKDHHFCRIDTTLVLGVYRSFARDARMLADEI